MSSEKNNNKIKITLIIVIAMVIVFLFNYFFKKPITSIQVGREIEIDNVIGKDFFTLNKASGIKLNSDSIGTLFTNDLNEDGYVLSQSTQNFTYTFEDGIITTNFNDYKFSLLSGPNMWNITTREFYYLTEDNL